MEAVHVTSTRAKDEHCAALIVEAVPALVKYKPRLFASELSNYLMIVSE